jgi:hypothetical protein
MIALPVEKTQCFDFNSFVFFHLDGGEKQQ